MFLRSNSYKLLALLLITIFALPILLSVCYIVPGADDFCNANQIEKLREEYSILISAFITAKDCYMKWQGTYFGTFLIGLHPDIHYSYYTLRIVLLVAFFLYVCGAFLSVKIFLNRLLKFSVPTSYFVGTIFTLMLLNTTNGGQWFTWYTGSCIYLLPMICYFYSLIFLLNYFIKSSLVFIILSCLLSFPAAGGSLSVTSFGCSILLLPLFFLNNRNNLLSRKNFLLVAPFTISVVGGLLNALAPGNYVRHSVIEKSGELHVLRALKASFFSFQEHLIYLLRFSILLFLGIVFIIVYKKESIIITLKQLIFTFTFCCMSIIFVAFPILLGYSSQLIDFFSRLAYSLDIAIIFYSVVFTISLACYLRTNEFVNCLFYSFTKLKKVSIIVLSLITLVYFCPGLKNGYSYKTFKDLKHGYIQEATSSLEFVYSELSKAKNVDVVLNIKPYKATTIYLPGISEDPNHWVNTCTSTYLGAKSCSIKFDQL